MPHTLHIQPEIQVLDLKKEFAIPFPYLKLEVFHESSANGKLIAREKMIEGHTPLHQASKQLKAGVFEFNKEMSVGEFERRMKDEFGLLVQVFRKSGNLWLETSATDGWSLQQQSEEAESLARHWNIEKEDPNDHDIY